MAGYLEGGNRGEDPEAALVCLRLEREQSRLEAGIDVCRPWELRRNPEIDPFRGNRLWAAHDEEVPLCRRQNAAQEVGLWEHGPRGKEEHRREAKVSAGTQ